jgi:uncharacterized protein
MIVYTSKSVKEAQLVPFQGRPEDMGGELLEGDVRISLRIDFQQGPATAGIFEATRGKVRITFPFTEHATIHEGEVTLTDADGRQHTYKPGDTYFIQQGAVILWDVKGDRVRKSFFNIREG